MRDDVEMMENHEGLCTRDGEPEGYVQMMENHDGLCTDDGEPRGTMYR